MLYIYNNLTTKDPYDIIGNSKGGGDPMNPTWRTTNSKEHKGSARSVNLYRALILNLQDLSK